MTENKIYPFWEQSKTKPMIEDVLPYYLDGDNLKNAIDFITYLRENKIKPTWSIQNGWTGMYKGKVLYWIRLPQVKSHLDAESPIHHHFRTLKPSDKTNWTKSWAITPYFDNLNAYEEIVINEGLVNFFLENLHYCRPDCKSNGEPGNKLCYPGIRRTLFGNEVKGICHGDLYRSMTVWFVNPDETEIKHIKRLLELEKQAQAEKNYKEKNHAGSN